MALKLSDKNITLEQRLSKVDQSCSEALRKSVRKREMNGCASPYFKWELDNRIVRYFRNKGISFGDLNDGVEQYLAGINKEPLKPVEKGMRLCGIPKEFLMQLDDFEKLYFFAGVENPKEKETNVDGMDAYEIASIFIRSGMDRMAYMHNSIFEGNRHRRMASRGDRTETYSNKWYPPHGSEIRGRLLTKAEIKIRMRERNRPLIDEFDRMFREEAELMDTTLSLFTLSDEERQKRLDYVQEAIASKLDAVEDYQRKILISQFGAGMFGEYAKQDKNN